VARLLSTTTTAPAALVPFAGEGFTISLPGQGAVQKKTIPSAAGPIELSLVTVTRGFDAYNITYNTVAARRPDLDAAARGAASGAQGTLTDVRPVTYKGFTGRDFRVARAHNDITVFVRILIVKQRLFQIQGAFQGDLTAPPDGLYQQVLASFAA